MYNFKYFLAKIRVQVENFAKFLSEYVFISIATTVETVCLEKKLKKQMRPEEKEQKSFGTPS